MLHSFIRPLLIESGTAISDSFPGGRSHPLGGVFHGQFRAEEACGVRGWKCQCILLGVNREQIALSDCSSPNSWKEFLMSNHSFTIFMEYQFPSSFCSPIVLFHQIILMSGNSWAICNYPMLPTRCMKTDILAINISLMRNEMQDSHGRWRLSVLNVIEPLIMNRSNGRISYSKLHPRSLCSKFDAWPTYQTHLKKLF